MYTGSLHEPVTLPHRQLIRVPIRVPDQAVGIAADVLNAIQSLGSYLVIRQLIQLQRQLKRYSGNAVVAEFLDCLQEAVRDRLAFYQLTAQDQQHPRGAWEGP
jgi:hypothetical protein